MLSCCREQRDSRELTRLHPERSRSVSILHFNRGAILAIEVQEDVLSRRRRGHEKDARGSKDSIEEHRLISRSDRVAPQEAAAGAMSLIWLQCLRLSVSRRGHLGSVGTRSSSCWAHPLRSRCSKLSPLTSSN